MTLSLGSRADECSALYPPAVPAAPALSGMSATLRGIELASHQGLRAHDAELGLEDIDLDTLSLRVQRRHPQRPRLSDDGFGDSVASIALNPFLEVTFEATRGLFRVQLSNCALSRLGSSLQETWTHAAFNTLRGAAAPHGIRFYSRPLLTRLPSGPAALQLRTENTAVGNWLAHPRTFTLLHDHVLELLQATKVFFCLLAPETLVAVTYSTPENAHECLRAIERYFRRPSVLSSSPLVWAQGFPAPIPFHTP